MILTIPKLEEHETYSKEISVTKESDRIRILEEISILIYEVFRLEEGKEMNIIIR